jgi:hypothetical protein
MSRSDRLERRAPGARTRRPRWLRAPLAVGMRLGNHWWFLAWSQGRGHFGLRFAHVALL